MMQQLTRQWRISLVVGTIGAGMILYSLWEITGGNTTVWPILLVGFLVFSIPAPYGVYIKSRIKQHDFHTLDSDQVAHIEAMKAGVVEDSNDAKEK